MNSLKITNKIDDLLHHSSEHLQEVKDQIPYWSREEQAKYADEVCRESVDNEYTEFIQQQMDAVENTNDVDFFKTFNTTSIGNLALLSLRAPSPYKEKAEEILQNYTKYHLGAKK
ncbi:hypothetical protein EZY14_009020 [Kordia sp. TARA_039_SRF]|nr:hypothetical protein EZY14_009020 [Kordia sp. TARA_039_SRF]